MKTNHLLLAAITATFVALNLSSCKEDEEMSIEEKIQKLNANYKQTSIVYTGKYNKSAYIIEDEKLCIKLEIDIYADDFYSMDRGEPYGYNPNYVDFYCGQSLNDLKKIERGSTVYVYPFSTTHVVAIPYFYEGEQKIYGDTIKKIFYGEVNAGLDISDGEGGDGEVANTIYFKPYIMINKEKYYDIPFPEDFKIKFALSSNWKIFDKVDDVYYWTSIDGKSKLMKGDSWLVDENEEGRIIVYEYNKDTIELPAGQTSYYIKESMGYPGDVPYKVEASFSYSIGDKTYKDSNYLYLNKDKNIRLYDNNKYVESMSRDNIYEYVYIKGAKWLKKAQQSISDFQIDGFHIATEDDIKQIADYFNLGEPDTTLYINNETAYWDIRQNPWKITETGKADYSEIVSFFELNDAHDYFRDYYYYQITLKENKEYLPIIFFFKDEHGCAKICLNEDYGNNAENYLFVENK